MPNEKITSDIYVNISEINERNRLWPRIQEVRDFYRLEFGHEPTFYVRVPGRVNIIGEHVDYCGYPVLPMAIEQSIILAVGYADSNDNADTILHLRNVQHKKFPHFKCDLKNLCIDIPKASRPEWHNYFLCGVKGIYENLDSADHQYHPCGMKIALSGNIPPASGLSSSSALVSAAVLCTAYIQRLPLNRKQLASISANCERYIGTQGGGMDQAIAYLAKEGCAQFIEFHPELQATPIELPGGVCFVVANSLAEKNKAASSDFNERVVECRLATRLIAKCMGLENWPHITRFSELQSNLDCDLQEMESLIERYISNNPYSRAEICKALNVDDDEFASKFLTANTQHMKKFKLKERALHVIQESIRVERFRNICETHCTSEANGDSKTTKNGGKPEVSGELARLMRQSHHSLKELYECSHNDLDRLIEISDDLNVAARLTGAGWGGCIVALCDSMEKRDKYIRELKTKYFSQSPPHVLSQHQGNDFADVIFSTFPCSGAEIFVHKS